MAKRFNSIETNLIKAGEPDPKILGAVSIPVFQSSTFEYAGEGNYHSGRYIRLNNTPNHLALHEKLAAIENAEAAIVASSGMAAISTALLTFLNKGDHLLIQDNLYGGTHDLVTKDFPLLGIEYDFIDASSPAEWEKKFKQNTKAIYVETISNPLMEVGELDAVAKFAKAHNIISMIDNTFASPVNFRPVEHGFDISLHSCTKYLNGHSDLVAGAAIGSAEHIEKIRIKLNHLGGTLDPHTCFLLHRGMKTLAIRMKYQNESGLKVAEFLEGNIEVSKVNYPGLRSNESYQRASKLLNGFSAMISFELKGGEPAAEKLISNLKIPIYAVSLGGVETLIILPSKTSHAGMSPEERKSTGISDGLIRLSVGIEDTKELIDDFKQALKKI
jgi:cystathionine beta-lyase/cystathionine gamma-synthase